MTVGAKLRFDVFKRDAFTCQYCGKKAPDVVLHADHIKPRVDGGSDDILNLVTSCIDCNLGKGPRPLSDDSAVRRQVRQMEELQARREQIDMLLQWRAGLAALDDETVAAVCAVVSKKSGFDLSEHGKKGVRRWLKAWPLDEVLKAVDVSFAKYSVRDEETGAVTDDSFEHAFNAVAGVCRVEGELREKPYLKDLYYVRAMVRRRCSHFLPDQALAWLDDVYEEGATVEELKRVASAARNWSSWQADMADLLKMARQRSRQEGR